MQLLIYHNGECSKCRELTELLQSKDADVQYKFYLHEALSIAELKDLLQKLNFTAKDIIRTTEPVYTAQYAGAVLTDEEWLQAIVDNPVLLQRPIVVYGSRAVIARPAEKVLEIL